MSTTLYAFPTAGSQTLRALSRHPSRAAFVWDGGSISYRAAAEVIGQMQKVFVNSGLERGHRVAILTANRAEAWCAAVAAQLCAASITWLHPLGSLEDQLDQIEDSEASAAIVDAKTFRERGGELVARAAGLKSVFTLGPAEYGGDLLSALEGAGSATPVDPLGRAMSRRSAILAALPGSPRGRCGTTPNTPSSPPRFSPISKSPQTRPTTPVGLVGRHMSYLEGPSHALAG